MRTTIATLGGMILGILLTLGTLLATGGLYEYRAVVSENPIPMINDQGWQLAQVVTAANGGQVWILRRSRIGWH